MCNAFTRAILKNGFPIKLVRLDPKAEYTTKAHAKKYQGQELVGSLQQTAKEYRLSASELAAAGLPDIPKRFDRIFDTFDSTYRTVELVAGLYEGGALVGYRVVACG